MKPVTTALLAAALTLSAAQGALGQSAAARVKTTRSGDWEWHVQDGRRVASTYPGDGAAFTVTCPSPGGAPGVFSAFAAGEPVARRVRVRGNSFVADDDRKAQRVRRLVERIKGASRRQLSWGNGGGMRLSLRGSAGAIGDCR